MSASQQNSNSPDPVVSSTDNVTNNVENFEKISPVLEIIYVMVKNIQKYLRVYAEDIKATSLSQYSDTYKALDKVRETLDGIYNISDNYTKESAKNVTPVVPVSSNSNVVPVAPVVSQNSVAPAPVASMPASIPSPLQQNNNASAPAPVTAMTGNSSASVPMVGQQNYVAPVQSVPAPATPTPVAPAPAFAVPTQSATANDDKQVKPENQKIDSILSELRAIREKSGNND